MNFIKMVSTFGSSLRLRSVGHLARPLRFWRAIFQKYIQP